MISLIRELFYHQAWADAAILSAIGSQPGAAEDAALRTTLHHLLMTQRGFLSLYLNRPFDAAVESRIPSTFDELRALFRSSHREELAFVDQLDAAKLSKIVELPPRPDLRPTLAEILVQVVMHSQWHRGQCASRLRTLGGHPPTLDFLLWAKDHPAAIWQ